MVIQTHIDRNGNVSNRQAKVPLGFLPVVFETAATVPSIAWPSGSNGSRSSAFSAWERTIDQPSPGDTSPRTTIIMK